MAKGYVSLPSTYTQTSPNFSLAIHGFEPRFIAPHPRTNQRTLTVARGPIIYCVEDVDNPGEIDHFRNIAISADAATAEEEKEMKADGRTETYVAIKAPAWVRKTQGWDKKCPGSEPGMAVGKGEVEVYEERAELNFIPYYLRANRGGNGHMRVGLLRK